MPSTFTTRIRLEDQGDGENANTWGQKVDNNFDLIDEAIDGYLAKSVAGGSNVTLSSNNAAADESRQRVLRLTGTITANIDVIVPAVEKSYVVWNNTSGAFDLTFKPSGGTGLILPQGFVARVFTDGSTMFQASPWLDPNTGDSSGPLWGGTSSGTSTALTLTIPGLRALKAGQTIQFIVGTTVGSNPTLNVNGFGVKTLTTRGGGSSIFAGELVASETTGVIYDGTSFRVQKAIVRDTIYTSNNTWTKPTGLIKLFVGVQAPGGGGGGSAATVDGRAAGGGGGGGEYREGWFDAATLGASETVTVPAGGAGGTAGANNGANASTASFGAHITCQGGRGGIGGVSSISNATAGGGNGGSTGAGGDINVPGEGGGTGFIVSGAHAHRNTGGSSFYGRNWENAQTAADGRNGAGFGAGGNGGSSATSSVARTGGDGAPGLVRVWEYF